MQPPPIVGELKLHIGSDGKVWYDDHANCVGSDLSPLDFVNQKWVQDADLIRLLGTKTNAVLVEQLYNSQLATGRPRLVQIGSPLLCQPAAQRSSARAVFSQMGGISWPASVGGWHTVETADYYTYRLVGILKKSRGRVTKHADLLLSTHPAWLPLSFIATISKDKTCQLITELLDPRWYVDPKNPDRSSRLRDFVGLGRKGPVFLRWLSQTNGVGTTPAEWRLAKLVLDAWTGGVYCPPRDELNPRNFLWRIAIERDLLRASRVFLRYLRWTWLDRLTPPRQYTMEQRKLGRKRKSLVSALQMVPCAQYSPTLFLPEFFFQRATEFTAWQQYMFDHKK